jgi:hypothetical protein
MIVRRTLRTIVTLGVVVIVGAGTYAFTASNTVPAKAAGSGSGAISGFTVSAVAYSLNATNPQNIDSIAFTISPATTTLVKASVDGTNWYTCTNTTGSVACTSTSPQATVAAATSLTVVAQG